MLFTNKPESNERDVPINLQPPALQRSAGKTAPGRSVQTVIDAWVTISGNLRSEGDVQIEGKVCGDVHCVRLVIGKESEITGDIVAEEAVVRGKVKGMIQIGRAHV